MSSSGTAAPKVDTGNELRPPLQAWERLEGRHPRRLGEQASWGW